MVVALAAGTALTLATGCGPGMSAGAREPAPSEGEIVAGAFAALPQPDGAVPLEGPTRDGVSTTQSFAVPKSGPDEVFGFYERELADLGWGPDGGLARIGGGWRGVWARDGLRLEVSVVPSTPSDPVSSRLDLALTG